MRRRAFLALAGALAWPVAVHRASAQAGPEAAPRTPERRAPRVAYPQVVPRTLAFPRDHGAHPDFRLEWWYVTGWLAPAGRDAGFGFQITFFRARPEYEDANPSRFAPRQIVFAHAAIADPQQGRLVHAERAARAALDLAGADERTTRVWIDDWKLALDGDTYHGQIASPDFALDLAMRAGGAPLLQGEDGFSRKGARTHEASYYYSRPQLEVSGHVVRRGGRDAVQGRAWLDHEWSSAYLAPEAAGWDWIGVNFDDGAALMAFRMRAKGGGVHYAGGTLRDARGARRTFAPSEIAFEATRTWRSPRTSVEYPVALRVRAGDALWTIVPVMDDQELDSRASTGTIYWEGAIEVRATGADGRLRRVGRGYLELTGYWQAMRL